MNTPPLSTEAEERIAFMFPDKERDVVRSLLVSECGNNLPGLDGLSAEAMDRVRFAVLKLSEGELSKFDKALRLAKTDWRDLLMAAGFGENLSAHESWMPGKIHG